MFKMMCAGNAFNKIHESLLMLNDGSVNWNVPYTKVCDSLYVNAAYNNEDGTFGVHNDTGIMEMGKILFLIYFFVKNKVLMKSKIINFNFISEDVYGINIKTGYSSIPYEWEIHYSWYRWNNITEANYLGKPFKNHSELR